VRLRTPAAPGDVGHAGRAGAVDLSLAPMPKVLIVSASDLAPELGETLLWQGEVERVHASTPAAALEVARAFVPSLVVVEGGEGAPGVVRRLRESPGTRRSSIVVLARTPGPPPEELTGAGANLVLSAPADPASWNIQVEKLIAVPRRLKMRFPVRVAPLEGESRSIEGAALDLSVGGMLLEVEAPLAPGAKVDLRFRLPGGDEELGARGTVVRASDGAPRQLGIRFVVLEGRAEDRIRTLLSSTVPDRSFGRYEVHGLLGEGSMGRVYRAFDPLARRAVAIKTLKPEFLAGPEAEEYLRRFRREAQAAARLVHPNIITIFDVGDDYFVMELLEGATLQAVLGQKGRFDAAEALAVLGPVAEALDYAHAEGTVHRDIKPANIMVLADGRPKVMDFGVARLASGVSTASGQVLGSPAYMAPEQVTRSEATRATDLFSLGIVAYEMLTGHRPFEGEGIAPTLYRVVNEDPEPPSRFRPELPPACDDAFRRALAKDPAARFAGAGSFVSTLAAGLGVETTPPPAYPAPTPPPALAETVDLRAQPALARRRRVTPFAAGSVALLVLAALGALRFARPRAKALPPPPGLQITTEPAGAGVFLDGEPVGEAPLFLPDVPRGVHTVRILRPDHVPAELSLEVPGDGPPVLLRFVLQPLTGLLGVRSDPPRAAVLLDGRRVGTTPIARLPVPAGSHEVRLERPGFRPWATTVEARPAQVVAVEARLEPIGRRPMADELRLAGWVKRGDMVELGPGVTLPRKVSGEPARYPEAARRLRLRGTVVVELTVTEDGEVADPRVVESAGEILDAALVEAVRSWRYEPAESNAVQVRVRVRVSQTFGAA
jgi:serine/threonine-protein kinase